MKPGSITEEDVAELLALTARYLGDLVGRPVEFTTDNQLVRAAETRGGEIGEGK